MMGHWAQIYKLDDSCCLIDKHSFILCHWLSTFSFVDYLLTEWLIPLNDFFSCGKIHIRKHVNNCLKHAPLSHVR